MISKAEIRRMIQTGKAASYNEANKAEYKRLALKLMRTVAKLLGCYGPGIVRFNQGGIAVSGDAILHSDRVYITFNLAPFKTVNPSILVRACDGRKDCTGKANHWYSLEKLAENGAAGLAEFAAKVAEFHVGTIGLVHCQACTRHKCALPEVLEERMKQTYLYHIVWRDEETGNEHLDTVPWTSREAAMKTGNRLKQDGETFRIMSFARSL